MNNATYSGNEPFQFYLNLSSGSTKWNSASRILDPNWQNYTFDITPFGASLSSVSRIEIRFTGIPTIATVYIDDIRVWTYRTIDGTASISQTFQKPWATDGTPGSAVLRFDYRNVEYANLTGLNMTVRVNDTARSWTWWHNFTGPEPWTNVAAAIGDVMAPAGTYDLNISVRAQAFTPHAYRFDVQIDNVDLRAPNYRSGWYLSVPLDAGRVSNWGNVSWTETLSPLTDLTVETRSGASADTADGSWSTWSTYTDPAGQAIANPPNRFLQYQANLTTSNSSVTPVLRDITLEYSSYRPSGTVTTMPFDPGVELIRWTRFNASLLTPADTSVAFEVSFNGGAAWNPVVSGDPLSGTGTPLVLRATLATGNTSRTPTLTNMTADYEYLDVLASILLSPASWSGTTDESVRFSAAGFDAWGHPVPISLVWSTTDPKGTVDPDGTYHAGQPGVWLVTATNLTGGVAGSASVAVAVGALNRLTISPASATVPVAALQTFTLEGRDADDNILSLTGRGTQWTTDVGSFVDRADAFATFRARSAPGTGTVRAAISPISDQATVIVTSTGVPVINRAVPDVWLWEDRGPVTVDLTSYANNQPDPADTLANLKWTLADKDPTLYVTAGENRLGNHRITFIPLRDAWGDDGVVLWLEDATGARSSQNLAVHIRPVNDPPSFRSVPKLGIKYDLNYTFDFAPYIDDVDNVDAEMTLRASDPAHAWVQGTNVSFLYDGSYNGRQVWVLLNVTDPGGLGAETVVLIDVGDNAPPNLQDVPAPVTLQEDEFRQRVFPKSLTAYFSDPEGDALFFTYGFSHLTVSIQDMSGFWEVSMRPERDWFGVDYVTIRATDQVGGGIREFTVRVTVTSVNDPPILLWQDDITVAFDLPYTLDLTAWTYDVDDPVEALTLETNRTDLVTPDGMRLTFLASRNLLGPDPTYDIPLRLWLNDSAGASAFDDVFLHVGTNEPPILVAPLDDLSFLEDASSDPIDLRSHFFDTAGPLTYRWDASNLTATIAGPIMTVRAAEDWFGFDVLRLRAVDPQGAFVATAVLVEVVPVDDAPVLALLPSFVRNAGDAWVLDLADYATDIDTPLASLRFNTSSGFVTAVSHFLVFDYPPDAADETVWVAVTDGTTSVSRSLAVRLQRAPTIADLLLLPWSAIAVLVLAGAGFVVYDRLYRRFGLDDVFLIGREGRLIYHNTRRLRADQDPDILAAMMTAIMEFVKDSFREEDADLKKFEFRDRVVAVERAASFIAAAIYSGRAPAWAAQDLRKLVADVEAACGDKLSRWSGDVDDVGEVRAITERFVRSRRYTSMWTGPNRFTFRRGRGT